jgi:hypothetical protein
MNPQISVVTLVNTGFQEDRRNEIKILIVTILMTRKGHVR